MLFRSSVGHEHCCCCCCCWSPDLRSKYENKAEKRRKKVNENKHIILRFFRLVVSAFTLYSSRISFCNSVLLRFYSLETFDLGWARVCAASEKKKVFCRFGLPPRADGRTWTLERGQKRITRQSWVWKNAKEKLWLLFVSSPRPQPPSVDGEKTCRSVHLFLLSLMNFRPFHFDFIADDNEFSCASHTHTHTPAVVMALPPPIETINKSIRPLAECGMCGGGA